MGLFDRKSASREDPAVAAQRAEMEKHVRETYEKKRAAIPGQEVEQAQAVLADPRIRAAGLEVREEDNDVGQKFLRLWSLIDGTTLNVLTETDRPTLSFAGQVMHRVESYEVALVVYHQRQRAAKLGCELAPSSFYPDTFSFVDHHYPCTYAGLQRFLFDLNAREIYQQALNAWSAKLQERNWYLLRGERNMVLCTNQEQIQLPYHEDSVAKIGELLS